MIKKTLPIFFAAIFVTTCGFYFFSKNPSAYVARALEFAVKQDLINAEKTLQILSKDFPSYPSSYYRAQLAIARKKISEGDRLLTEAFEQGCEAISPDELLFTRALVGFLKGNDKETIACVMEARELNSQDPALPFLNGLQAYLEKRYSDALECWSVYEDNRKMHLPKTWAEILVDSLFSSGWKCALEAHCLMEEGDVGLAQQLLEMQLVTAQEKGEEEKELILHFLGLATLKESHLISSAERDSAFRLAHYYLDQGTLSPFFWREKNYITDVIFSETIHLISSPHFFQYGFSFLHLLEKWKMTKTIENAAETLEFCLSLPHGNLLCDSFQKEFSHSVCRDFLLTNLSSNALIAIKERDLNKLQIHWNAITRISSQPRLIGDKLAGELSSEIFVAIQRDSDKLLKAEEILNFWKYLQEDTSHHLQFAHSLIGHSEMLWKKEGFEKKATRLMDLALTLVDDTLQSPLKRQIEQFLTTLYRDAQNSNMVRRLSLVYDALDHFHLGDRALASPESLANHLADAAYLMSSHQYASAQTHAEWILKLEPFNEEAIRLHGLSSFFLGEYADALVSLKKLSNPDQSCKKALILSKIFSSEFPDAHLAQISEESSSLGEL